LHNNFFSDFKINKRVNSQKINKYSKIELLAKTKLNSNEEKFTKAVKDVEKTDDVFMILKRK
jgi:hypothetical protein